MKKIQKLWKGAAIFSVLVLAGCSLAKPQGDVKIQNEQRETSEQEKEQGNDSLIWLIDDEQLAKKLQGPMNELLKEKGVSYTVSIVSEETDWASEGAFTEMLQERRESGKATDLIYIPQMRSCGNDYATLVREDLLLPLPLEEGEGSVTEILGEFAVSSVEVDGKPYGLRGLHQYYNQGLKFNQYYLEKHGISAESLSGNILENEELFRKMAGKDEQMQTPLAYWELTEENLGYQFLFPSWAAGFSDDQGEEIVNVFAMEDTKEYLKSLKKFRDEGLISFLNIDGFKDVEVENGFFSITASGTRPESYQTTTEGFYDKDGKMLRTETLFVPGQADPGSLEINPRGHVTGIASWSQKPEEACAFLTLLFTDADVANLVKFGVEGSDYRLEEGRVTEIFNMEQSPQANSFYINDVLTYPMEEEPEDKQENWNRYFEKEGVHPLTGFQFDPSLVEEEIRAANAVLRSDTVNIDSYTKEFRDLMSGRVEDVDQALGELNEKLEAAGISKIIKEANRQLQEWKKTKGE